MAHQGFLRWREREGRKRRERGKRDGYWGGQKEKGKKEGEKRGKKKRFGLILV